MPKVQPRPSPVRTSFSLQRTKRCSERRLALRLIESAYAGLDLGLRRVGTLPAVDADPLAGLEVLVVLEEVSDLRQHEGRDVGGFLVAICQKR